MSRYDDPDRTVRLEALSRRQQGVATTAQLRDLGYSDTALSWRCRADGTWERWGSRAVLLDRARTERQHDVAALLVAGPGSQLAGRTAALRHGLRHVPPGPPRVLLLVHTRRRAAPPGVRYLRTVRLPDPVLALGVPCSPVARAVADAARDSRRLDHVRALAAEAVQRRMCTVADLAAEHEQGPVRGRHLLGRALLDLRAGTRSVAEAEARDLVLSCPALPEPLWNPTLVDGAGRFVARPDAYWPVAALVWEIDSVEYHTSPADQERTMDRRRRMSARGLHVVESRPSSLRHDAPAVASDLLAAYRRWSAAGLRADVHVAPEHSAPAG